MWQEVPEVARIQHKSIRKTIWESSKFEAHGEHSLATRLSVYKVFHGLLACSEFPYCLEDSTNPRGLPDEVLIPKVLRFVLRLVFCSF